MGSTMYGLLGQGLKGGGRVLFEVPGQIRPLLSTSRFIGNLEAGSLVFVESVAETIDVA